MSSFQYAFAKEVSIDDFYELKSSDVDLDNLIKISKMSKKGHRFIIKPRLVRFSATIQQKPKEASTVYLLSALSMMGMADIPATSYQMFIRSDNDSVIAVYVEDKLAKMILDNLEAEQKWGWQAIHSYNNHRGPALLLTSVNPLIVEKNSPDEKVKNHD